MLQKSVWTPGVCCVSLLLFFPSLVYANDIKAVSTITDVTIYPGAALVTRQAEIDVPLGDHTVLFDNIIPQINENTLTVKGQGAAEVKIFGAAIKVEYLTQALDERVNELQAQIEALDDEITVAHNTQGVLGKQSDYLDSVKLFSAQQIPKDLITKTPSVLDLEGVGGYLAKGFAELASQNDDIRLKLRTLERQKEALNRQLQELNSHNQNTKRAIAVDIQALRAGKLILMVSYLVNNVNWQPLYDARVAFEQNKVDLSLFALINQTTGEDWVNSRLTISTARPSLAGMMPELSSWWIRPYAPPPPPQRYSRSRMVGADLGVAVNSPESEETMLKQDIRKEIKEAVVEMAQTEQKGITVVFKITKPVTIKSDGSSQRVPITALSLPAHFEYAATPKLSAYAYLRSEVENNQSATLLPGRVNVFLDGDYVGASVIAKAIGQKEKFDLYLGADESVTVKRELIEEKSDDTLFANIPSANKVIRYVYKITVENYKAKPITINVFDHVPVSGDDKVKMKDLKFIVEPTQKDYKDRKGVMRWSISLKPQEKKEISYSFAVERPRDLMIEGL